MKKSRKIHKTFAHPLQNHLQLKRLSATFQKVLFCTHLGRMLVHLATEVNTFCFYFSYNFRWIVEVKTPEILTTSVAFFTGILKHSKHHVFLQDSKRWTVNFFFLSYSYHSRSSSIKQTHLFPIPFILSTLKLILPCFFVFLVFSFLLFISLLATSYPFPQCFSIYT